METGPRHLDENEIRIIDGKKFRRINSGYTVRQYYSHETPEKGPGPGWDSRQSAFEKYHVADVSELPNVPHFFWEEIDED